MGEAILMEWQNDDYPVVNSVGLGSDLDDNVIFWRLKETAGT